MNSNTDLKHFLGVMVLAGLIAFPSATSAFPILGGLEDAVVLIETVDTTGDTITYRSLGTGFVVKDTSRSHEVFLVSNRHVFHDRDSIWVRFNLVDGSTKRFSAVLRDSLSSVYWRGHPDTGVDVAALPIVGLPTKIIDVHRRAKSVKDVSLGDEVYFVGFPLAKYTKGDRNYPILRHGVVSYISEEDITADSPPDSIVLHKDMILIDATILPGNSGSPVLSPPKPGEKHATLIGLIQGHLYRVRSGENLDLGIVVPTDRILDVLELFR